MSQNFLDMQSIPLSIGITCKFFSIVYWSQCSLYFDSCLVSCSSSRWYFVTVFLIFVSINATLSLSKNASKHWCKCTTSCLRVCWPGFQGWWCIVVKRHVFLNFSRRFLEYVILMQTQSAWLKPVLQISITDINFMFQQLSTWERCFSSCHEHGTKKKFWVPMRNQTSDLQIPCSNALSLSHRDYSEGGLLWSSVWHTSCTLLGSAMSIISFLYIEY